MSSYELVAEWSKWWWPLLANHLWQATLFSVLALAAARSLGRAPARARYLVWLIALIKFALPSALLLFLAARAGLDLSPLQLPSARYESGALAVSPLLSPVTRPSPGLHAADATTRGAEVSDPALMRTTPGGGAHFYSVITCVWLTGCAALLVSWLRRERALSASLKNGRAVTGGREAVAFRRVRSRLGLRRKISLVTTPALSEPGVWGAWRPMVVLPDGVADQLDDAELEAIFAHELSHIKRWDNMTGNFQRALCCVFWFHPLVWVIDRRLLAERERACDDAVVGLGGTSEVYVKAIAKVCHYCLGREAAGLAKVTGSDLRERIERIVSHRAGKRMSPLQASVPAVLLVMAVTFSAAAGGGDVTRRDPPTGDGTAASVDTRFEITAPGLLRGEDSASGQAPAQAVSKTHAENTAKHLPHKEFTGGARPYASMESSVKAAAAAEHAEVQTASTPSDASRESKPITQEALQPITQQAPLAPQTRNITAPVVSAADVSYGNLRGLIGRYEVDPTRAENFVLDITLEGGELWLKPSHSLKRRLVRKSETDFSDSYSDYDFACILDHHGRVIGLRLNSWGRDVIARKLTLPPPSIKGNVTFRLRGFPDAKVVAVAGDFNNWNQSQFLFVREGGQWVCRVSLPAGTYQYKFIVDGNWLVDPSNPMTVHDDRGFENSFLRTE